VEFGVSYFPTHDGLRPGAISRLVEERGQDALFFPEHTHIPASRESPFLGGEKMPDKYAHTYDLFVALGAAAEATTRLRLGSGICLVIERDPIITAKEVASVDHLTGGRFDFAVGAGWNREEMVNHGTDPRRRMAVLRERIEAMRAIWTQDEATYHGEHVSFERIWSWPKPAQRPHPPVLIGGDGPTVLDRVLAFGDGWYPAYGSGPPALFSRIEELFARAERPVQVQVATVPCDPAALERLQAAGVRRVIHPLPSGGRSVVERELERWEASIAEFTGR
jgi:probable F420-dependent oxidoreductase